MNQEKISIQRIGRVSHPIARCIKILMKNIEIRAAILEGDMDKALKYTNAYFPKVLQDNPHILFKLRCRKFLEMMCKCSDSSSAATTQGKDRAEEEMEVDDGYSDGEGMDTEEPAPTTRAVDDTTKFHELLTEAVQYGQQLRMDYPSDEYGGDKQYLDDIFSLVAYPDPRSSVHGHHLDASGRVAVADDLNSAILGMSLLFYLQDYVYSTNVNSIPRKIVNRRSRNALLTDRSPS